MNTSRPVASSIEGVQFGLLSLEDVANISVKRITSSTTFDLLLNPIPGGLYDLALGAALHNLCSTCHLDEQSCPGHCGHIELPFYLYHCAFMDQVYRLLRAQCMYCQRLKMSRADVNRFCCKLKLINYGLLKEAKEVDDLDRSNVGTDKRSRATQGAEPELSDATDDEEGMGLIARRLNFVKKCIREKNKAAKDGAPVSNDEAMLEARKAVIMDFKAEMLKSRQCRKCKGISPSYRKNRFSSIFRKPLSAKDRAKNAQSTLSAPQNPLRALNRLNAINKKKLEKKQARRLEDQLDEGVADLDSTSTGDDTDPPENEFEYQESSSEGEGESPDTGNNTSSVFQTEAGAGNPRKTKTKSDEADTETYISASEVHASLVTLFAREPEIMGLVYQSSKPSEVSHPPSADMFFVRCLLVPPNKFRKESKTGPDSISEPPEHSSYKQILRACEVIWQIQREINGQATRPQGNIRNYDDLQRSCVELQDCVNSLFDSSKSQTTGAAASKIPEGIKQKLERKEGLFRMFIMGKRVNFAARTVLSPDPNIETNEIGIPPVFAKTLTYPEPVTAHSFDELRQAVINGPNKWPGATAVEHENGQVISLRNKTDEDRQSIANTLLAPSNSNMTGVKNKRVHRHLNNGDIVIMNRQPTLHKPSMMCHRAKVLLGEKTIRMHYANCNTYNADFDGDEMNLHFPQNEIARAEALQIADTDHQYLSGTAGDPLRGLIQDHISMGLWLTCKDMFFSRQEYQQLLYSCLRPENSLVVSDRVLLVEPAILKPTPTWTGKQVVTTVLKNIRPKSHAPLTMESSCATTAAKWNELSEEGTLRIHNGELLTGILDKKQIGPKAGGLNHSIYEVYGHTVAGIFMGILGRLLNRMLNMRAFSCGVQDIILTPEGEIARKDELKKAGDIGLSVASKYVSLDSVDIKSDDPELLIRLESVVRDDDKQAGLDVLMNSSTKDLTSEISRICLPGALIKPFPQNQMQAMVTSGAKGTVVNANLISCNLGQQVLEGRRVPTMVSGKTLPSFKPLEPSIRAGGYIIDRFLTGIRPQEFFFHAMAGREGLIDTAVKTARSGYLQRCLVKGLEGLRAEYDTTIRDADGSIIQSLYGEDGLEITKYQTLVNFQFLSKNFMSIYASLNAREDQGRTNNPDAIAWNERAIKLTTRSGNPAAMDPALSQFPPAACAGSVSENFYAAAKRYIKDNPDKTIRTKTNKVPEAVGRRIFEETMRLNYLKAVVAPGEAVGVVAAQSIGEPSTQMTLNTFHLAGHSAKNVTLGIPRLREILMTASKNIKTPTMTLYPIAEMTKEDCDRFAKSISRLSLAEIIDSVKVEERIDQSGSTESRIYEIRLIFYPSKEYTEEHAISITDVAQKLELSFLPRLQRLMKMEIKRREQSLMSTGKVDANPEVGESAGRIREHAQRPETQNEGGDSDEEEGGDDDATTAKRKANLDEGATYEDPDDEDEEIVRQGERDAQEVVSEPEDEGYGGSEDSSSDKDDDSRAERKGLKARAKDREARVKLTISKLSSFSFDESRGNTCKMTFEYATTDPKILLLGLVRRAARETLIQEISGIRACTSVHEVDKPSVVLTEGINLVAMQTYQDIINPHRIYTNDIYAMAVRYGVEAARDLIIKELGAVFGGHAISVDHRHLTLVADYMTRNGGYQPFSRIGMRDKRSPFAKMSFETTMGFLSDAVLEGEAEDLTSPSARITMGKVGKMGTGMCDVFLPSS